MYVRLLAKVMYKVPPPFAGNCLRKSPVPFVAAPAVDLMDPDFFVARFWLHVSSWVGPNLHTHR